MVPEIARSSSNIRNERAELLVHYSLSSIDPSTWNVDRRFRVGKSGFSTEFDHVLKKTDGKIVLVGQTTCYKERGTSGGEPNKTYEMRETLMELLLVHVNLLFSDSDLKAGDIRFFNIISGDPSYSYSYFHKIRSKCYDLNVVLHPTEGVEELYDSLEIALPENVLKNQECALAAIEETLKANKMPVITKTVATIRESFAKYFELGFPKSPEGEILAEAARSLAKERNANAVRVSENLVQGLGIKQLYLEAAKGDIQSRGNEINKVVKHIFEKRKFLPEAKRVLEEKTNWKEYVDSLIEDCGISDSQSLDDAAKNLWNIDDVGKRELIRRVLVKLPGAISAKGTAYPQDISVKGVSEHNLYRKIFEENTTVRILSYLLRKLKETEIGSIEELKNGLYSYGRPIVKDSFDYDIENGTVIKPIYYYMIEHLAKNGYNVRKQKGVLGSAIKGFHGELFDIDIGAFTSIEVICSNTKKPLALFKAKYFRPQEFDRRVKEEGFVSFTSAFKVYKNNEVSLRRQYDELPFVMFIDTDSSWTPEPESIKQLVRLGWDVFFRISDVLDFLENLRMA